jgi:hypothetical protein
MINTRKIKPISFWSKDGDKLADHILLYNFHGYNFDGTDSWVSYKLGKVELIEEDKEMFYSYFEGSVPVPNTVVQDWGEDDEPIFDFVIDTLNLDRDE